MFSVIIPLYNKENSILNTINSVLNQSFMDFELIIVNDGSTDDSREIVNKINDYRIKVFDKPNGGVSSARNYGIDAAQYEYIAFIDGDDLWTTDHLEILMCLLNKFDNDCIGGYSTSFMKIHSYDNIFMKNSFHPLEECHGKVIHNYFEEQSKPYELLSSSNFMIKKSKLQNIRYNTKIKYGEDVEFWYRYFGREKCKLVHTEAITAYYFIGAENRASNNLISLDLRFSDFDFSRKSLSEKKYLGKLVAISIIDYILFNKPLLALKIFLRYIKYNRFIFRYFYLLIRKKFK